MTNISSIHATNEIKCPHCGTVFTIDEAQYADIAQQVRTAEFDSELHARLADAEKTKQTEIALAVAKAGQESQQTVAEKDAAIQRLQAELTSAATTQDLAVAKAVAATEKQLLETKNQLQLQTAEQQVKDAALKDSHAKELAL